MITEEHRKLLALIESWENGYISPSAQLVLRDARLTILNLIETIEKLNAELDDLRAGAGTAVRGDVDIGGDPEPKSKSPRKLRNSKSSE
jgi:hypothetical protein